MSARVTLIACFLLGACGSGDTPRDPTGPRTRSASPAKCVRTTAHTRLPGRPGEPRYAIGQGPVQILIEGRYRPWRPGAAGAFALRKADRRRSGFAVKFLTMIDRSYGSPVTLSLQAQGEQGQALRFRNTGRDSFTIPAPSPPVRREEPTEVYVPGEGCYALHFSGPNLTEDITFETRVAG